MNNSSNLTTKSIIYDPHNADSILSLFSTPDYKSRQQRARRKSALEYWKTRLLIDGLLMALGFILGAILV